MCCEQRARVAMLVCWCVSLCVERCCGCARRDDDDDRSSDDAASFLSSGVYPLPSRVLPSFAPPRSSRAIDTLTYGTQADPAHAAGCPARPRGSSPCPRAAADCVRQPGQVLRGRQLEGQRHCEHGGPAVPGEEAAVQGGEQHVHSRVLAASARMLMRARVPPVPC